MLEQVVAQVIFDVASDVEDDEAREPADRPKHQRENDHQLCVVRDQVGAMLVGRVYRVADEQRNDHRERGVREGAGNPEYVTQPVASRVGKQTFHGQSLNYQVCGAIEVGSAPLFSTTPDQNSHSGA